jgi:hypothetical protein
MQVNTYPRRYSDAYQLYKNNAPYPMNFMQAPSFENQILVNYGGQPALQGLSTVRGPFMFPVRQEIIYPVTQYRPTAYPVTHSLPDPYQQQYINTTGPGGMNFTQENPLAYSTSMQGRMDYNTVPQGGMNFPRERPPMNYGYYTRK